jgi:trehalose 6-phosphate phosphatase
MVAKYTSPGAVTSVSALTNALFLDFDGTLAPLQDDPDTVALPDGGAEILLSLSAAFDGALVLISGRDIRDLSARTPQALWRAGGHGLDVCAPGQEPVPESQAIAPEVRARIDAIVTPFAGVRVEDKGPVLAIHYRQNAAAEGDLMTQISAVAADMPDYKSQHGKMVIELKPIAANKGRALASIMQDLPFRRA